MKTTEVIKNKSGKILAIVIYRKFKKNGTSFFTPRDFSQQMAFISRKKGDVIKPHAHKVEKKKITLIQETIFVKKGKIKVNLYGRNGDYICSRILKEKDVILLAGGGHGFEAMEDFEIIEVKQGPYVSDKNKIFLQ